ncbi:MULTISPECIES: sensor histidine kinase [unclassified Schaalia]|uniref:sensor histidine kinase n=1 Tax=unclassified Schaalia TaxID=2691889 RepID=UPI001E5ACF0E|nr:MULTISPECIES: GAF domain-containing protein [unclassified Schaalia]MCD4549187.1 GAF domain-containing protein [Schaalia sp. lx-260]MCD4557340.1 GAF domain-containing protein [Schaalia sp. lx-100]
MSEKSDFRLLEAVLDLTSNLDSRRTLKALVEQACHLAGARHGTLSVIDTWGDTVMEIMHGEKLAVIPQELIVQIPTSGHLLFNDLSDYPELSGIENFLGVPILVHGRMYARMYLTGTHHGFNEHTAHIVEALAHATGVGVENAQLYSDARRRERWITASQSLTTTMLEGTDEEDALVLIAQTVREVARADTAVIVLPSVGDTWAAEITEGHDADRILGAVFPAEGRAMQVLAEGTGMLVDSLARATSLRVPVLSTFGPALYAPLRSRGRSLGVLILLRLQGAPEFDSSELTLAESLASQATLALALASARHAEDMASLLDERDRIGRDLHDFAIQQLFATGMRLDAAKQKIHAGDLDRETLIAALDHSLAGIDEAVRQIRAIVHDLREPDRTVGLVERVRRESSLSRSFLGFAPSLLICLDDHAINQDEDHEENMIADLEARVGLDLSDDVVAVVREGLSNIARHARATAGQVRIDVTGQESDGMIHVSIADDGQGIDPHRTRNSGLSNMTERARRHGGSFTLSDGIGGRGTRITWCAPLS